MNPRTVGVAPGTYTLQLGAPVVCPPDGYGTGAYGTQYVGQYNLPNNWFGIADTADMTVPITFDPYRRMSYGYDQWVRDGGVYRSDHQPIHQPLGQPATPVNFKVLGAVAGVLLATVLGIHYLAGR